MSRDGEFESCRCRGRALGVGVMKSYSLTLSPVNHSDTHWSRASVRSCMRKRADSTFLRMSDVTLCRSENMQKLVYDGELAGWWVGSDQIEEEVWDMLYNPFNKNHAIHDIFQKHIMTQCLYYIVIAQPLSALKSSSGARGTPSTGSAHSRTYDKDAISPRRKCLRSLFRCAVGGENSDSQNKRKRH